MTDERSLAVLTETSDEQPEVQYDPGDPGHLAYKLVNLFTGPTNDPAFEVVLQEIVRECEQFGWTPTWFRSRAGNRVQVVLRGPSEEVYVANSVLAAA